jgi:alpha-N-arabinofuranosidase
MTPDGVTKFHSDDEKIAQELRRQAATRAGWPESELGELVQARTDALGCFWMREGPREAVLPSPDTGPHGGRAQRVQVQAAGQGIAQWTWLPLHRVKRYELEIFARSPDFTEITASLTAHGADMPAAHASAKGLSSRWRKLVIPLEVDASSPADIAYKLALTAPSPGQIVVGYVFLRPDDHIHGADPDVIRLLQESRLPILRWPGGNFVSGYHWEDGVGPIERRPTKPNFAWGSVEPNTFGTDEFIAFCRAVGCEPMICINAGSGTLEEAARWVEYCNGPASSPMGRLRSANGHRQPYHLTHWEIGNELWGKWQFGWTTASGYVDRFKEFSKAMLAVDPTIHPSRGRTRGFRIGR